MKSLRIVFAGLMLLVAFDAQARVIEVKGVRIWPAPDNTRLVFETTGQVDHRLFSLKDPDRLVIDLKNARLAKADNLSASGHLLSGIRTAPHEGDLRIVLDLKQQVRPKSFTLAPSQGYSDRLVIDLFPEGVDEVAALAAAGSRPLEAAPEKQRSEAKEPAVKELAVKEAKNREPTAREELAAAKAAEGAPEPKEAKEHKDPLKPAEPAVPAVKEAKTQEPAKEPKTQEAAREPKGSDPGREAKESPRQLAERSQPPAAAKPAKGAAPRGRDLIVAIDAGHGGEDPGAIGPNGTYEKDVVLAIARKLKALVAAEPGMKPVMIRDGDYFVSLGQRVKKARTAKADLFISIHADAFMNRSARGASVYMLSDRGATSEQAKLLAQRENDSDLVGGVSLDDKDDLLASVLLDLSQTATKEASSDVAQRVLTTLGAVGTLHRNQVERAGFKVLKAPDIPSILVETAFISNHEEERLLKSSGYQGSVAKAVLQGMKVHFRRYAPPGTLLAQQAVEQRSGRAAPEPVALRTSERQEPERTTQIAENDPLSDRRDFFGGFAR